MTHDILVIDDDKRTRWSLTKNLARAGYRVQQASSAAEGLAKAGESRPDLVLLNLRLPDGDGGSVLQDLLRCRPGLPVIMMSADVAPETVGRMRRLGARGFLTKPLAALLLQALIAYLL